MKYVASIQAWSVPPKPANKRYIRFISHSRWTLLLWVSLRRLCSIFLLGKKIGEIHYKHDRGKSYYAMIYDAVYYKDQPYISVPKTSEFKSGPWVVKMVLNTQCSQYLWLTMWFHKKKQKKKSLILLYKFVSRLDSAAVSIFVVTLVVNSTNITTNIETAVLSTPAS